MTKVNLLKIAFNLHMARGDCSKISVDLKRHLIATWEDGGDYLAAAIVLGIKPATARSIVVHH